MKVVEEGTYRDFKGDVVSRLSVGRGSTVGGNNVGEVVGALQALKRDVGPIGILVPTVDLELCGAEGE